MVKMNMVEKFTAIKAMLNGEKVEGFSVEDAVKFLDTRIEQTEKKNASGGGERKPTKTQLENEVIKEQIVQHLGSVNSAVSVGDICKAVGIESNQKVTSLVTQLRNAGKVKRIENKGKAYYHLAK